MKIHKQEATFQPITITLESQEEVDQMYAILLASEVEGTSTNNWDNILHDYLETMIVNEYNREYDEDDNCMRLSKI